MSTPIPLNSCSEILWKEEEEDKEEEDKDETEEEDNYEEQERRDLVKMIWQKYISKRKVISS